jgi:hypothetical protein
MMSILCTQYEYMPSLQKKADSLFFALLHSCKINMEILDYLVVYENIDYLWCSQLIAIV